MSASHSTVQICWRAQTLNTLFWSTFSFIYFVQFLFSTLNIAVPLVYSPLGCEKCERSSPRCRNSYYVISSDQNIRSAAAPLHRGGFVIGRGASSVSSHNELTPSFQSERYRVLTDIFIRIDFCLTIQCISTLIICMAAFCRDGHQYQRKYQTHSH